MALNNVSQGKKAHSSATAAQVKNLQKKCAQNSAPTGTEKLKDAYSQELNSFYRFAEAIAIIETDKSPDSLSRLYRCSANLQKNSKEFENANIVVLQDCLDNSKK